MAVVSLLRSMPGRLLRVGVGMAFVAYGSTHPSLLGLVLTMVGIVPAVTGLADICLLADVGRRRQGGGRDV